MINVILALMIIACFLVSVTLHEYAHALAAMLLGDSTPRSQGRQSLSLSIQLDPLGTLLAILLAFQTGFPMALGWGKPVKTDPWKLRGGPNGGTLMVSLAGMLMNLLLGVVGAVILRFLPDSLYANGVTFRIGQLVAVFAVVNITLFIFNILPVYPLDGYQILYTLLPSRQALKFARSAQYGPIIIICLVFILPFIGAISGLDAIFIFRLPSFILELALLLVSLVSGSPFATAAYFFPHPVF